MIIMFVQSDKYNLKGLLKIAQCVPGFTRGMFFVSGLNKNIASIVWYNQMCK